MEPGGPFYRDLVFEDLAMRFQMEVGGGLEDERLEKAIPKGLVGT